MRIAVCGAGTMGSGIAQVCAQAGNDVILFDVSQEAIDKAKIHIDKNLRYLVDKERITAEEKQAVINRIHFTTAIEDCTAFIIIEAVAEIENVKIDLFNRLAEINNEEVVFASNTSSLSISDIQRHVPFPGRMAGMHFFNPPYIMPLVEVVRGELTSQTIIDELVSFATSLGKQPVGCNDSPGFIVNRVARPYYLESLRLYENNAATFEQIDRLLEASGFKMGPFRLMDMIGMDINLATSRSVYEALQKPDRLKPSPLQADMVSKGNLGKKSGRGFYQY